jgi:hypothetical protein
MTKDDVLFGYRQQLFAEAGGCPGRRGILVTARV